MHGVVHDDGTCLVSDEVPDATGSPAMSGEPRSDAPAAPVDVMIADDHALFRDGLAALINRWDEFRLVATAADGQEAIDLARRHRPALVLMDVRMPRVDGVAATRAITAANPDVRVVMLTMSDSPQDVFAALRSGAHGYVVKDVSADRLYACLSGALNGAVILSGKVASCLMAELGGATPTSSGAGVDALTEREHEVLALLVDGLSNEEIGRRLHLSEPTVKKYLGSIMAKLHVKNRVQAAVYGVRQGIA